ncbi:MAG: ArsA family ATPase [Deltaproteobacteria bacterium]|nr:ArsA family ATPase [Deltaproteobacteria bacterium]
MSSALGSRRVVLVSGKGGVGKTTVSVALALAAARRGKRVLLCETQGATRVPAIFGRPSKGYEPMQVATNLDTLSITPEAAIEEYVLLQLHFRRLYRMVFRNRIMGAFVDAVPGLHDLIQLGKVWFAERETANGRARWDLVVVDAPATGHGLTMLGAPRAMMDLTGSGPFHDNAKLIADLMEDEARTALLLVSTAEEMPLRETVDLYARLGDMRRLVGGAVLNEVHPSPVPSPEAWTSERAALLAQGGGDVHAAIDIVDDELRAVSRQADARNRLASLGRVLDLPFQFHRDLSRAEYESFATALEVLL